MGRTVSKLREDALAILAAALGAVDPRRAVAEHLSLTQDRAELCVGGTLRLPLEKFERAIVVGAGKAGAAMACGVEGVLGDALPYRGFVNVKYGHTSPLPQRIVLHECGHPLPDDEGVSGAATIAAMLDEATERDLLLVLISGGASALLPAPALGISLEQKQEVTDLLLRGGATINELNAVRKHLSALKGGQLALRAGAATVVALVLSDVVGDRLDVIGSGPTVADSSTFAEALTIVEKYAPRSSVCTAVKERLRSGSRGELAETAKPEDLAGRRVLTSLVGSNRIALERAESQANALGYNSKILSSTLEGEAKAVGRMHAEILREVIESRTPATMPACILSGGETTVTVRGAGMGGRNQEFALSAAIALEGIVGAVLLAAGTDGSDGPTDAAGGLVDGGTIARARAQGMNPMRYLEDNDSYPFLAATGDLLRTGPTGTNVMDVNILLTDRT